MDILKITYSGATTSISLYIENDILMCGTTSISLVTYDTITKLKTELEKITGITATILNSSSAFLCSKINEISRYFPAEVVGTGVYLSYDNYSSPKQVCETFSVPYANIVNSWFDNADNIITAQTGGFKFKEITETSTIDVHSDMLKTNDKYINKYGLFYVEYNELYLPEYAPIQSVSSLSIDSTSVTYTTLITTYNSIILTSSSEVSSFVEGQDKVAITFTYGYPKTSSYGVIASQLATYIIYDNLISYVASGTQGLKPITATHSSLVLKEEGDNDYSQGVTNRQHIRTLFKGLPSKINMRIV
jgi:hypothetical protein